MTLQNIINFDQLVSFKCFSVSTEVNRFICYQYFKQVLDLYFFCSNLINLLKEFIKYNLIIGMFFLVFKRETERKTFPPTHGGRDVNKENERCVEISPVLQ